MALLEIESLHVYYGHMDHRVHLPQVLGHEMSGIIERAGAGVTGFKPGDRVCVAPNYNPVASRLTIAGEGHLDVL